MRPQPQNRPTLPVRALCLLLLAAAIPGCDLSDLLSVSDPSRVAAEDAESPIMAETLVNGAIGDFECALGAYVVSLGVLSDELTDRAFVGVRWFMDRRDVISSDIYGTADCTAPLGVYMPLSTARWANDNTFRLLEEWSDAEVPNRQTLMARTALYAGFSLSLMGTAMCSAALDGGPEMTSQQLFAQAEERFTTAMDLARAQRSSSIENAARVGRSRVRFYQGNEAGALTDARAVPTGFVLSASASSGHIRSYNRVWHMIRFSNNYGIAPESQRLATGGVEDPRSRTFDSRQLGGDGAATVWYPDKYPTAASPIPVARWAEAQLIIAEIEGGQTAVDVINALRAPHGLPSFASTDATEIQNAIVEERRRELFLEGHRHYDIRRLNLPLDPPPGAEYQPGVKGGFYGESRCLPLPDIERVNNPNIG